MGGGVAQQLGVDLRRAPLLRVLQVLDQKDGSTFARHVPVGTGIEGPVGVRRVLRLTQQPVPDLAGEGVRSDRSLRAAADDDLDAPPDVPAGVAQPVQPTCLLRNDDPAGTLHPVLDRELPRGGGIEPGDRLVGTHEARSLAPEVLDLPLAELVAA